jgi:tetratricopeptide (TPR) repeat protein
MLGNLASVLGMLGRYDEAIPLFEQSVDVLSKAYGEEHAVIARLLYESGGTYAALGQSEPAREHYAESLEIREQVLGDNHPDLARSLDGLAALYVQEARYAEAEAMLERAVAIHEQGGTEPVELGQSLGQLGLAYAGQNRVPEAQEALRRSLEIVEQELDADHPLVAATRENYERISAAPPSALDASAAEVEAAPVEEEAAPAE